MRTHHFSALVILSLLMIFATACSESSTASPPPISMQPAEPTLEEEPEEEAVEDPVNRFEDFDSSNFDDPTNIDNPWYSLKPGTRWVFTGSTEDSGLTIPHQIIFTVTDLTKVIEGVRTTVVYVEDYSEKDLVEAELAFYAQDNSGNVWYFGEYPEEYTNGVFEKAPAWIAGLKGARAGIKMKAEPKLGMPSYSQGWGPAVNWTDYGTVDEMVQEVCVPFGCYQDVLVIAESSIDETDAFQLKYYAKNIGEIKVGWRGTDATKEILELSQLENLSPDEMAQIKEKALNLEKSALKNSKEVYAVTSPLE